MTTMTFRSRPVPRRRVRPKIGRTQVNSLDVIAAFELGFRPVLVSVAIVIAAITWATPAHPGSRPVSSHAALSDELPLSPAPLSVAAPPDSDVVARSVALTESVPPVVVPP